MNPKPSRSSSVTLAVALTVFATYVARISESSDAVFVLNASATFALVLSPGDTFRSVLGRTVHAHKGNSRAPGGAGTTGEIPFAVSMAPATTATA